MPHAAEDGILDHVSDRRLAGFSRTRTRRANFEHAARRAAHDYGGPAPKVLNGAKYQP